MVVAARRVIKQHHAEGFVSLPPGPVPIPRWRIDRLVRVYGALFADPLGFVAERFRDHGDLYSVDEGGGSRPVRDPASGALPRAARHAGA